MEAADTTLRLETLQTIQNTFVATALLLRRLSLFGLLARGRCLRAETLNVALSVLVEVSSTA